MPEQLCVQQNTNWLRPLRGRCGLWLLLLWLSAGCSVTKYVPEDDALFWKYNIRVKSDTELPDKGTVKTELAGTVIPRPNAKFLGVPFKLMIHSAVGPSEKKKGFRHWLANTVGQPPVLFSTVDTSRIQGVMRNRLHNRGYFDNHVASTSKVKKQKATIDFTATLQQPYRIRKVEYPAADTFPVFEEIRDQKRYSQVKEGEPYNLQVMIAEREKITERLLNRGFYNFSPDMLLFSVDSTIGNRQVDVYLRVKPDTPVDAMKVYTIEDVYIYTNYSITDTLPALDTVKIKDYMYIPNENYIRGRHLVRSVFIERGQKYSARDHTITIRRLMGMGSFQYANIRYDADTIKPYTLDASIYLTPALKKSLRVEARGVTKTNNFAGPGLTVSFRNRNALKGSELLAISLISSYETQVSGHGSGLNSYEIGLNTDLTFPRFMAPFSVRNSRSDFVPKTIFSLGYSFLNRVQFFQMNSFHGRFSYNWRPNRTLTWHVTPVNIQYVELLNTTSKFDSILRENTFLQRSFQQQYIFGSIYQLTYSNQIMHWKKTHFFNNIALDLSGNLINTLKSGFGADKPTEENPRTIGSSPAFINKPFSQYTRLENDFRYYYNFTKTTQLATRLITGVGYAYGNSSTLPYVKQFTIGGTNSIRAFRARSIGPGVYKLPEDQQVFSYFDQTGDIKLETNVEYRFPFTSILRGAFFVDAGNIWLVDAEEDRPGGEFKNNQFLSQLAVGTGFGLRVDVEFFVLRFDLGVPVRRPAESAEERNALKDFKFGFSGENSMVLNIAIGYPF